MLRITVLSDSGIIRLKLEGKLACEWVREAEKAWTALARTKGNTEILVDLLDVSFVDDGGQQLLAEMRHTGAQLLGSGPLMSALIEEIEDAEAADEGLDGDIAERVEHERKWEQ